jgi:multicomponent Na+:H+ antiporter subunit D
LIPELPQQAARQILATLGAGAILFGSVVALRQARLKVYIGYSTAAQIG